MSYHSAGKRYGALRKESDVQRDIIGACEAAGAIVYRMNAGSVRHNVRMSPKGTPDLLVVGRHRSFWVEVKGPDGKVRPEQKEMHDKLRDRGWTVVVARGVFDLPVPF